jgi:hypothetical protein
MPFPGPGPVSSNPFAGSSERAGYTAAYGTLDVEQQFNLINSGSGGGPSFWGGLGVPPSTLGANNDYYFRGDGTEAAHTLVYHKESGSWVATAA